MSSDARRTPPFDKKFKISSNFKRSIIKTHFFIGFDCFYLPLKSLAAYLKHVLKEVNEDEHGGAGREYRLTKSARNCIQLILETFILDLLWRAHDVVARVHAARKTIKNSDLAAVAATIKGLGQWALLEGRPSVYDPPPNRGGRDDDDEQGRDQDRDRRVQAAGK